LELEQGVEVYIPNELSVDRYPISYRFYDPIILISNSMISLEAKLFH